jgi:hypothetical protein
MNEKNNCETTRQDEILDECWVPTADGLIIIFSVTNVIMFSILLIYTLKKSRQATLILLEVLLILD